MRALALVVGLTVWLPLTQTGCVTVAEFRKLEREVLELKQQSRFSPAREQLADLVVRLDSIETQLAELEGRLEVVEHQSAEALEEARAARSEAAQALAGEAPEEGGGEAGDERASEEPPALAGENPPAASEGGNSAQEVADYRAAYAAWRDGEPAECIDRFRSFLQTYPSSSYADDAAFWMADCYFKQGDYKTAILRYDDVVSRYPNGNKASEALYRQGEALLRLGPGYAKAASKAFERVIREYPDSPRAAEAKRQLELLQSSG